MDLWKSFTQKLQMLLLPHTALNCLRQMSYLNLTSTLQSRPYFNPLFGR